MKRQLNGWDLFSIALGSVIGWGAFFLPGNVFLLNAGVTNTLIGFSIAIVMIFFIEKSYSLLLSIYPSAGGEYIFARKTFGEKTGFATGWLLTIAYLSIIPLNATAVPMVLENITDWYVKGDFLYEFAGGDVYQNDLLISLIIIIFFTYINYLGTHSSKFAQNICVFSLLFSLFIILALSLFKLEPVNYSNYKSNLGSFDWNQIVRIIAFAPWAFIGFDTVAQMSDEFKVNSKKASYCAFIAVVFGGLVYNLLNIYTAFGVPNSELTSTSWATGKAVYSMLGPLALGILSISMFGAVISGLNGFFMGASRLLFAIVKTESNDLFQKISINKLVVIIGFFSCLVPFFGRNALIWFVDLSSVGASFAYLITCLAAFKLSSSIKLKVYSIFGVISSLFFLVFLLTPWFGSNIPVISSYCLLIWVVLGVATYFKLKKQVKKSALNEN